MSNPDEIRAEIAQTRSDLSNNVNALGVAIRPATWPGLRSKVGAKAGDLKDRVMGSAQDTVDAGADASSGLKDSRRSRGVRARGLPSVGVGSILLTGGRRVPRTPFTGDLGSMRGPRSLRGWA